MKKITILSILLFMAIFCVLSCGPTVSQEEYDRVNDERLAIQNKLTSLQGKLAEAESLQAQNEDLNKQFETVKSEFKALQAEYEERNAEYEALAEQSAAANDAFEALQAEYEELNAEYEALDEQFTELSEQYETIMGGGAEIAAQDVEQAIFNLVNQERIDNGLDEVMWGENIYKWAIANSRSMAANKRLEYTGYIGWQEVFWATGYGTEDKIARAALTIWQNHQLYERNLLNVGADYGAVGVHKEGEIFYITYVADYFK